MFSQKILYIQRYKMKFKKRLIVPILILLHYPLFAQGQANEDAWVLANTTLNEGIKLAKSKKMDKARVKFNDLTGLWQFNHYSSLYLTILDDVETKRFEKKKAGDIFKALEQDTKGESKKAAKTIGKVVKKYKDYFPAYIVQGNILVNWDKKQEAEEAFTSAIDLATNSTLPQVFRGKFYAKEDRYDEAILDYSNAISRDSTYALSFFERGFIYCLQRDYDNAINDFKALSSLQHEWTKSTIVFEAYHNRGVVRMQKKSYKKAIEDFNRAIEINPDYLNAYLNRGRAYKNLKSYSKALKDFTFCVEQDPKLAEAFYQKATIYYNRRNYDKAIESLQSAAKLTPDNKKLYFEMGESYYYSGKYGQAIMQFNKVIELDNNDYWAHYRKGFAYQKMRQYKQAMNAYQAFLQRAPKHHSRQILHAKTEVNKLKKRL